MKQVQQDGLTYLINEKEEKAKIVGYYEARSKFLIPRSIKYESQEYIVQIISKNAFEHSQNIKSIEFASDSELQIIEKKAFSNSSTKSIFIPASVIDLKEGWCCGTHELTTVKVDPRNSRYSYLDDKMIICKSSVTNENYDEIVFCRRDIKEITIPSFIKIIGSYSFNLCQLEKIDIPSNSELQTIEKGAFLGSSISSIIIPPHVTKICKEAFSFCSKLQIIDIPSNSELQIIEKKAFSNSLISSIIIPPHVTKICEEAFYNCYKLQQIDIPSDSELQTIESGAFLVSSILSIFIPSHVTEICEGAFSCCSNLKRIDFPSDSELQTIENKAFSRSSIESIFIPASVIDLKEGWCCGTHELTTVKVDPRNSRYSNYEDELIISRTTETNENYEEIVFCRRDIKEITIPSFIKVIGSYSFSSCKQLKRIDIPSNSELQTIEKEAFSYSSISSIFIPPHVTKICEYAFSDCKQLNIIDIPSNSELQTIEKYAFSFSSISSIFIPPHVTKIGEDAFSYCKKIHLIEIGEKSGIKLYNINSIFPSRVIIMIPAK